jgi:hypothetical protein
MDGETDEAGLTVAAIAQLEELAAGLAGDPRFKALMAIAALKMAGRERAMAGRLRATDPGLRHALRHGPDALSPTLHAELLQDAILRTAVTKPAMLTAEEQALAEI